MHGIVVVDMNTLSQAQALAVGLLEPKSHTKVPQIEMEIGYFGDVSGN